MEQTAVDWLIEQLTAIGVLEIPDGSNAIILTIQQAKELEKQQTCSFGAKCCLMTRQQRSWNIEDLYDENF